jgi:hypothetical protein
LCQTLAMIFGRKSGLSVDRAMTIALEECSKRGLGAERDGVSTLRLPLEGGKLAIDLANLLDELKGADEHRRHRSEPRLPDTLGRWEIGHCVGNTRRWHTGCVWRLAFCYLGWRSLPG